MNRLIVAIHQKFERFDQPNAEKATMEIVVRGNDEPFRKLWTLSQGGRCLPRRVWEDLRLKLGRADGMLVGSRISPSWSICDPTSCTSGLELLKQSGARKRSAPHP